MRTFRISGLWAACQIRAHAPFDIRHSKHAVTRASAESTKLNKVAIDRQGTIGELYAQLDMVPVSAAELQECRRKFNVLNEQLEVAQTSSAELKEHLDVAQASNAELKESLDVAQTSNAELKEQLEVAQTSIAELKESLEVAASEQQEALLRNAELNESLEQSRCEVDELNESLGLERSGSDEFLVQIKEMAVAFDTVNAELEEARNNIAELEEACNNDAELEAVRREKDELAEKLDQAFAAYESVGNELLDAHDKIDELTSTMNKTAIIIPALDKEVRGLCDDHVKMSAEYKREVAYSKKVHSKNNELTEKLSQAVAATESASTERDEARAEKQAADACAAELQIKLNAAEAQLAAQLGSGSHGAAFCGHPSPALSADTPDAGPSTWLDAHGWKLNDEDVHAEAYSHVQLENVQSACARMYAMFLSRFGKSPMTTELEHCTKIVEAFVMPAGQNDFEAARAVLSY